ncbi:hypothetical protein AB3M83_02775 [Microbacterium sp. 179-B 1A2 NHS]|uniref:hypothetical protein n=1 Tax=Microbacterium sp. 179-B 1A2 NHS TaxID=3142383 RepID=UPI0039A1BFD8
MPYRSLATLETWLTEFTATREGADLVKVVPQDGSDGSDTGLIVVPLRNASTTVYVEPIAIGESLWRITFEPRLDQASLSSTQVHTMADELQIAADLCDFIEMKSAAHLAARDHS